MGIAESNPGEIAWVPIDSSYPSNGPKYVLSGDLKESL